MHQTLRTSRETLRAQLIDELWSSEDGAESGGRLLRTSEVAALFQVSQRAVTSWAARGQLPSVRTPGGHHRYPSEPIRAMLGDGLRPQSIR